MSGCSTVCPNCKHEFQCCAPSSTCCAHTRRTLHALSGGGLVTTSASALFPAAQPLLHSPCLSPQVSPSAPLAFVLPSPLFGGGPPLHLAPLPAALMDSGTKPETDMQRLSDTVRALRQSGWYYEGLTYQQSHDLLQDTAPGTFLVRNSSDPKFLFSLSLQTERGPTSVRLFYINGYFRLDAQAHLQAAMPLFPSVIELVQHYVEQTRLCRNNPQVWVDPLGKWYASILLVKPLHKKARPSSLKHLARIAVHKALRATAIPRIAMLPATHTRLELPQSLIAYLSEYPFPL